MNTITLPVMNNNTAIISTNDNQPLEILHFY